MSQSLVLFFQKTLNFIAGVLQSGLVPEAIVADATKICNDIQGILRGITQPAPELLVAISKLIVDLDQNKLISGVIPASIASDAEKISSFISDIKSGQAGIEGKYTLFGVAGSQVFIPDGGPAAQALGIS